MKAITFKDNQGCLDLIEKKKTGVMAMISEEIYVPKGSDVTMLEKLHKQNYGYNDFYTKPQYQRGGRNRFVPFVSFSPHAVLAMPESSQAGNVTACSTDQGPGPNEAFTIKHYAGSVPYKVDGFLEKCKDRLPPDSEELLMNSSNKLVKSLFADGSGMSTPKSGGRPQTLGEKFVGQMQVLS